MLFLSGVRKLHDIRKYEKMMMFDLPDDERVELGRRFDAIASGFEALGQADTDGGEPLVTVLELSNVLREDIPEKLITRDELLSNAPERQDGFVKAPGTL